MRSGVIWCKLRSRPHLAKYRELPRIPSCCFSAQPDVLAHLAGASPRRSAITSLGFGVCVWPQEDLTCSGSLAFLDPSWQPHLDSTAPGKEKKQKGGVVFNRESAMTSQPQENVFCPARMGKSLLKWSPGLPSADHPGAIVRVQTSTRHHRDTATKEFIHWLLNAHHTQGAGSRKNGLGKGMCPQGRRKYSSGNFIWTDFFCKMFPLMRIEYEFDNLWSCPCVA